ncbi:TonB-dependent receptor [Metallibacterium scheffleri]|jgi:outer membrane receptor protein involved in Fe transport|uniref:TonB-dependent receptor n=1 Tax=Metallibacterium scheffleri TaxID=993689 RepID=UPI0026F1EFA7|nr:TonB-dependent receptor [Metallibacterium scheffleri]MBW8076189.1 TonB-dependent receptor plug domain-containing protein [Metallibacterium scheffleri]
MKKLQFSPLFVALASAGLVTIFSPCAHAQAAASQASAQNGYAAQKTDKKGRVETLSKVEIIARELTLTRIPMHSAYSESVIGPSAIRFASPMLDVQGLLERTPSINVRTPAANGVRTNITFRAFSSGQFSETFDGVPINDPFNGGTTNSASTRNNIPLTLNDINSVNIYRGINNPAVTSYNSLGGTIAFEPRTPGNTANASVDFGGGSFDTWFYALTANTGDIGGVRSMISINHNSSSGWQANSGNRNTNLYYAGVLPYDGGDGEVYAYAIYNANKGFTPHTVPLSLIQQYGYNYGWPLDWTNSYNKDHGGTYILGDRMRVNDLLSFNARVYARNVDYNRVSYGNPAFSQSATQPYLLPNQPNTFAFSPVPTTYDPIALFGSYAAGNAYHTYMYSTQQYGFMPHFTLDLPGNQIKFGGDYSHTKLHSSEYWYGANPMPLVTGYNNAWDEHDQRSLGSAFVQDTIRLFGGQLHVTPGLKYLYSRTSDFDNIGFFYPISGTVSDSEHYTSPTIGLNWRPVRHVSLYAAWGKTAKFPGIAAYYQSVAPLNSSGNNVSVVVPVHVAPEYVRDLEAGARYEAHGFEGALNVYREDFSNTFIETTNPSTGILTTSNGGSSRYEGIELDLQDSFDTAFGAFSVFGNISQNKAFFTSSFTVSSATGTSVLIGGGTNPSAQVFAGQPLAEVPNHLANLGVGWKWKTWRANLSEHYAGSQYVNEYNAGIPSAETIPSYAVMNLTLRDTLHIGQGMLKNVQLALHVDNVLDRHYYTFGYGDTTNGGNPFVRAIYEEPRAYFGSATIDF